MPQRKPEVLYNCLHPEPDHFVALLPQLRSIAEPPHRCVARTFRRHSASNEFNFLLLAMEGHLFVQFAGKALPSKKNGKLPQES